MAGRIVRWDSSRILAQVKDRRALEGSRTWRPDTVDGQAALVSDRGQEPPALELQCPLKGRYTVTLGLCAPGTTSGRLPGSAAVRFGPAGDRIIAPAGARPGTFHVGTLALSGRPITVEKANLGPLAITHLLFEPAPPDTSPFARGARDGRPLIWGIADQNDLAVTIGSSDIQSIAANVRYHRELGFNAISWHMYCGCCEYPTQAGSIFPRLNIDDPDHVRLLSQVPNVRSFEVLFRELIHRYDCMAEGLRLAHAEGILYAPCLRMNNEWHADWALHHAGTWEMLERFWCPEFFMKNPECWTQYKSGGRSSGLDYSHPAVRRYRLGICREILENYPGIDSLFLDLHRHAPMVSYPDAAVAGFRKKYGIDIRSLEPIDADVMDPRWHAFRARYFTTFMRDLKRTKERLGRTCPTVVRCGPTFERAMHEGADLRTWFDERLVDVLMLEENRPGTDYTQVSLQPVLTEAKTAGVACMGTLPNPGTPRSTPWPVLAGIMDRWLDEGALGIAFYESNEVVHMDNIRRNLPSWLRSRGC